jgi:hypothetical protein
MFTFAHNWAPSRQSVSAASDIYIQGVTVLAEEKGVLKQPTLPCRDFDLRSVWVLHAGPGPLHHREALGPTIDKSGIDPSRPCQAGYKPEIIWTPVRYAHLAAGIASKSVKLQRPARATVCSHSAKDATASVGPILMSTRPLNWSKLHAAWMLPMESSCRSGSEGRPSERSVERLGNVDHRAQRHQWEVGLSSPNRILDKTRRHCRAATNFWHQRLRPRRNQLLFIELLDWDRERVGYPNRQGRGLCCKNFPRRNEAPSNVSACEQTVKSFPDRICAVPLRMLQVPRPELNRCTTRECSAQGPTAKSNPR